MSQPSGSESSGGGKDNDGLTYIPFTLHRDGNTSLRHLYLEMPSGMEDISKSSACPKVFLLVNDKDKSQKDCLKMMHNLIHENVLGVKFWEEVQDEPYIRVYVEPYTAFVSELLKKAEFAVNPATHSVPSRDFRKMVWAAINALDYIRESGNYHGNFSWRTTLYLEANGNIVVKLAYFERKSLSRARVTMSTTPEISQTVCSAAALAQAVEDYDPSKDPGRKPTRTMDPAWKYAFWPDLQDKLTIQCVLCGKNVSSGVLRMKKHLGGGYKVVLMCLKATDGIRKEMHLSSVGTAKHDLEDHDFFWDEKRTKMFFAYEVPKIFKNEAVKNRFRALPTCPTLPWKTKWSPDPLSDPILIEMEKYRAKHDLGKYNENSFEDFLRFISGMYTHENLLRKEIQNLVVDAEVRVRFPRLSYDLNAIIRAAA
ncbi:hypothetical protein ACQJBY_030343 [Aegilops geniculata]